MAKREEDRADDRNIEGRAKDLQLRKRTLEEDIENLSESLHVKAEGIVKGTAQGVADWFTGKSKRRAKKAEGERGENKSRGFSPNKGYSR